MAIQIDLFFNQQLMEKLVQIGSVLLVALAILVAGWVIGRLVALWVERFVSKIGVEAVFRKVALGRALIKSGYTASGISSSTAKWIIYITAILIALKSLQIPGITGYVDAFLSYIPTLLSGFIILIVGLILSDWLGEFIKSSFPQEQRQVFYINLIGDVTKVLFYYVTITLALAELGVDVTILYIFAQALAWSLAIAVGIATGIILGWMLKDKIKEWLSS